MNLRAAWEVAQSITLYLRVNNLADAHYADRANFGLGHWRYLPAREREWFAQLRYALQRREQR